MSLKRAKKTVLAAALSGLVSIAAQAGNVEVLHYWTSGGEAKSAAVLKQLLEAEGHQWKDFVKSGLGVKIQSKSREILYNKLFKQIRHAWQFWFAVAFVFTE